MTTSRLGALALIALVSLAACRDDRLAGEPSVRPVVDSATMQAFAGTTTNLMQGVLHMVYGGQHLATPNPFILPALSPEPAARSPQPAAILLGGTDRAGLVALASSACAPILTGVDTLGAAIDSDADGIPDDLTVDYGTGCTVPAGPLEYTFSGKYRLQDFGGGLVDWEYTTTALSAMVRDTATGNSYRQTVTGTEAAHLSVSHATHLMDATLSVAATSGADSSAVSLHTLEQSSFDPDGGSTFQAGGSLPQGTLHFGGEMTFRDIRAGTDSVRFVLSAPTPLHLSFACGTGIDGGVLQGLLEGDASVGFRFTWSGCLTPQFEMFGASE